MSDNNEALKAFLKRCKVLAIDQNSVSRTFLMKMLEQMGIEKANISEHKSFETARVAIIGTHPEVIFCDNSIGYEKSIELLHIHRGDQNKAPESVFFFLTENTSQAVIGRIAEEDMDGFLLKPFTKSEFEKTFQWVAQEKLLPTDYQKSIKKGRDLLFKGDIDQAVSIFETALGQHPEPATAHFYLGQAKLMRKMLEESQSDLKMGLTFNQIHSKCLVGMFDVLMEQNKSEEAYEVLRRLIALFPQNPKRLSTALSLAVKTANFRDIEDYYGFFQKNPEQTVDLINHMCSALAVNGKYHLIKNSPEHALISFNRAVEHGDGKEKYVVFIIETLKRFGFTAEAQEFEDKYIKNNKDKKAA